MKYWVIAVLGLLGLVSWNILKDEDRPLPDSQQWDTIMHVVDGQAMRLLESNREDFSQTIPITVKATWFPANQTIDLHMHAYVIASNRGIREANIHLNQTTTGTERTINGQLLPDSIDGLLESLDPDVMLGDKLTTHDIAQIIANRIRLAPHQAAELFLEANHIDPQSCASVSINLGYQEQTGALGDTRYIALWQIDATFTAPSMPPTGIWRSRISPPRQP